MGRATAFAAAIGTAALGLVAPAPAAAQDFAWNATASTTNDPELNFEIYRYLTQNPPDSNQQVGLDMRWIPPSGQCDPVLEYFETFRIDGQAQPQVVDQVECLPDGTLSWVVAPFVVPSGELFEVEIAWQHTTIPQVEGCWVPATILFPSNGNGDPTGPPLSDVDAPYTHPEPNGPDCGGGPRPGVGSEENPQPVGFDQSVVGTNGNDFFVLDELPPPEPDSFFDVFIDCGLGNDLVQLELPPLPDGFDAFGGNIRIDTGPGLDQLLLPPDFHQFNGTLEVHGQGGLELLIPDPTVPPLMSLEVLLGGSDPLGLDFLLPDPLGFQPDGIGQPIPVQITDLDLTSLDPIVIDFSGAQDWDVQIDLSMPDVTQDIVFGTQDLTIAPGSQFLFGGGDDLLLFGTDTLLPPPLFDPLGQAQLPLLMGPGNDGLDLALAAVTLDPTSQRAPQRRANVHTAGHGLLLDGGEGDDVIVGSPFADRIVGGAGADLLDGGPGADVINGGPGADRCDGRGGLDVLTSCENDPRGPIVGARTVAGERIALTAADNVAAAIAWSQHGFPEGGAATALLARADLFADPLTSGFAQGLLDAPLLLTATASLDARVSAELQRLGTSTVHIVGGPNAVSEDVRAALEAEGYTVTRVAGDDRVATAVAIAQAFGDPTQSDVLLARGFASGDDPTRAFVDSLASGATAAANGWPLLLTQTETLTPATREYLLDAGVERVWIVGGVSAVTESVANEMRTLGMEVLRRSGTDRFRTAAAIGQLTTRDGAPDEVIVVDGSLPDSWAHGLPAARAGAPVALAAGPNLTPAAATQLVGARLLGARVVCAPGVTTGACDQADALAFAPHWSAHYGIRYSMGEGAAGLDASIIVQTRENQPWICASWIWTAPGLGLRPVVVAGGERLEFTRQAERGQVQHGCVLSTNERAAEVAIGGSRVELVNDDGTYFVGTLLVPESRGIAVVPGGVVDIIKHTSPGTQACVTVFGSLRPDRLRVTSEDEVEEFGVDGLIGCENNGNFAFFDQLVSIGATVSMLADGAEIASGRIHVSFPPGA